MKRSKIFSGCCNSLQWFLMGGDNYKLRRNHINRKNIIWWQNKYKFPNKRRLSAEGCSLLPSALRPRLLGGKCINRSFRDIFRDKIASNCARFAKNTRFLAILALFQIVAASTIFGYFCSTPVSAASLTLTIPSSFSLDIAPSSGGAFVKSEAKSFNVKTDNEYGYTLSVKAKNSDNSNVLLNGSNKLSSISESTTEDNFKSDTKFNNTWGFLPNKFNGKDNTSFLPGPTTEESILEATKKANNGSGTDYNITLGAKVDNTMSSGNYNNNFIFSATANEPLYDAIMQDWRDCSNLGEEQTIRLLDIRDDNVYTVAKLKDGKCWMTQNLRITGNSISESGHSATLNSNNSNLPSGTTYELPTTSTTWNDSYSETESNHIYYADNISYGAYYTWYTATAGTGTASMTTDGQNATGSICPKGWRLPSGVDPVADFRILVSQYTDGAQLVANPVPAFNYAGYFSEGLVGQGSEGHYWTSAVSNGQYAHYLDLWSNKKIYINPTSGIWRAAGLSVRCIAGEVEKPENKGTMQTVKQWGNSVEEGETVYAVDERDNITYTVARLKDGKLWMTENLVITGCSTFETGHSKTLTSSDSDLPDDTTFTLPDCGARATNGNFTRSGSPYYDGAHYYWKTATAGTGTSLTTDGQNATGSICPKGWRLPTSGSDINSDFQLLAKQYTNYAQLVAAPTPAFTLTGWSRYNSNNNEFLGGGGSYGYYWSSTLGGSTRAYIMFLDESKSKITPDDDEPLAYYGYSVRCIAR